MGNQLSSPAAHNRARCLYFVFVSDTYIHNLTNGALEYANILLYAPGRETFRSL